MGCPLAGGGAAVIHAPNCFVPVMRPCPGVVTIPDLAFETHPGDFGGRTRRKYQWIVPVAARSADRVIAVGAADPIGLSRFLRAHAELAELVEPDRIVTVINKLRASAIGLNAASQVRQTLARFGGIEAPVMVPWDPAAFDAALLGGRALVDAAPRSAARVAIRDLAAHLVTGALAPARSRRRPSR